jgi:hypothetical protein
MPINAPSEFPAHPEFGLGEDEFVAYDGPEQRGTRKHARTGELGCRCHNLAAVGA